MSRPASSFGRNHRTFVELRKAILNPMTGDPDVCCWCGHAGTNTVNHTYPLSRFPALAHVRANLRRIHGREGCPVCRTRWGRGQNCNTIVGDRILWVEVFPPGRPERDW